MADTMATNGQDALDEKLTHLSKKSGVKATIVLDRATGSILRTNGQLSALNSAAAALASQPGAGSGGSFSGESGGSQPQNGETQGLDVFAVKVWNWVNTSSGLVEELDDEDEMKLLRLRTKKQELVIVPDAKYLLIVVHDTPPA